jgi:SAM-dependent methyltransferase
METQYNAIAGGYKQVITTLPERQLLGYNLELHEGDVAGKAVLDLACGTGDYTRGYKLRGARQVAGVDISQRMIELAQQTEAAHPLGIEYQTADVAELGVLGSFDLVTAFGLLHYAPTREQLHRMQKAIYANLRPGGRFVTANKNILKPEMWAAAPEGWQRYNVRPQVNHALPLQEGDRMTTHLHWNDTHVEFNNYYFTQATYEAGLVAAGFQNIKWHHLILPPQFEKEYGGRTYWQYMLDHAYMVILEAERPIAS